MSISHRHNAFGRFPDRRRFHRRQAGVAAPAHRGGLKKARCTIPVSQAEIVGNEQLSTRLRDRRGECWRDRLQLWKHPVRGSRAPAAGAQLLTVERWDNGQIRRSYSVRVAGLSTPRPERSVPCSRRACKGDCGTIQEMKWTGWHFRLLNVWKKDRCDGETFEWDSRDQWQVFPTQAEPAKASIPISRHGVRRRPRAVLDAVTGQLRRGPSLSKCPRACSHQSRTRLGTGDARRSMKNQNHPVARRHSPRPPTDRSVRTPTARSAAHIASRCAADCGTGSTDRRHRSPCRCRW